MILAIPLLALAAVFAMIGQHAQRSVGGRDFYIASGICLVAAVIAWRMKG